MHRAFPLIVFTTASGAGFGLLALVGILAVGGAMPAVLPITGLLFVAGGVLAARRHLGRPVGLMRALTRARTSWLSREAVAAATCAAVTLGFIVVCAWPQGALVRSVVGLAMAVMATAAVACTAMIYASLRPVPQWHTALVPASFLLIAAMTGALLARCLGGVVPPLVNALAVATILAAGAVKRAYWRRLDGLSASSDTVAAAGLDRIGRVRLLDPPLAAPSSALSEMGGGVSRARTWRRAASILLFVVPLGLSLLQLLNPGSTALACAAALAATAGVLLERWLFFAEARHVSSGWFDAGKHVLQ
jgi:DMSO reductase anchor subunit